MSSIQSSLSVRQTGADELVDAYQRDGDILQWPVPDELQAAMEVSLRNVFAEQLARRSVDEIVRSYTYLSPADMARLLHLVQRHVWPHELQGLGIELGAGCGLLAAVAASRPAVRAVFAVEVCERFAQLLIRKVARGLLGENAEKVVPVVGSFNELCLPDASLDFAIENDSLHHSDDLPTTMSECARVLKPGGILLCFDRCHPNEVTDEQVERMLSAVYSREFLQANCYPTDLVLTRRENGEHEYRLFEWEAAARAAGMTLARKSEFQQQIGVRRAAKGFLSLVPRRVRRSLYRTDNASLNTTARWFAQEVRARLARSNSPWVLAPKRTTVLVFQKPC